MNWQDLERRFGEFEVPEDEPVFPLKVVCHLVDMNYWTLHEILRQGMIQEAKRKANKKFLSTREVKKLKIIKYLMDEKGVNIQGVKVILEMRDD